MRTLPMVALVAAVPLALASPAPFRREVCGTASIPACAATVRHPGHAAPPLEAKLGTLRFPKAMHDADQSDTELGEAVRASAALNLVRS
jgi:hypothetical protein